MKIGFIGLGNMGAGMAANLLKAGHEVTAYNRSQDKVAALAKQGAKPAKSVAEACGGDVVVTMLANDDAVAAVAFGDHGIIASLRPGATHVSSSTISVALSERLTAAHAEAGQKFVAAPVFGHTGQVAGCLSVSGPEMRMAVERMEEFGMRIATAAWTVSELLGATPLARDRSTALAGGR